MLHLWRGGSPWRLILYIVLSCAGFWIGHFLAGLLGWTFWSIGPLHTGLASLLSLLVLGLGYWLSLVQVEKSR
jgi:hypothetical protein